MFPAGDSIPGFSSRNEIDFAGDAMRSFLVALIVVLSSAAAFADLPKDVPAAIPLWERGAPGSEARAREPEEISGENVGNVHNPTLTPYVPEREKATGTAVVICPGGGHSKLCLGHEGYALAEWFRDRGVPPVFLAAGKVILEQARRMTWKGLHPVVKRLHGDYPDGVRLTKKEMKPYEARLERSTTLPKYDITIKPRTAEERAN